MFFRASFSDGTQKIVPNAIFVFAHPATIELVGYNLEENGEGVECVTHKAKSK